MCIMRGCGPVPCVHPPGRVTCAHCVRTCVTPPHDARARGGRRDFISTSGIGGNARASKRAHVTRARLCGLSRCYKVRSGILLSKTGPRLLEGNVARLRGCLYSVREMGAQGGGRKLRLLPTPKPPVTFAENPPPRRGSTHDASTCAHVHNARVRSRAMCASARARNMRPLRAHLRHAPPRRARARWPSRFHLD